MADCPRINNCPLFRNELKENILLNEMIRNRYCRNHFTDCARFFFVTEGMEPPENLYPNQHELAFSQLKTPV